jgi:hypothetical protein
MIRFYSEAVNYGPTHFNLCRDSSNQKGVIWLAQSQNSPGEVSVLAARFQTDLNNSAHGILVNECADLLPALRQRALDTVAAMERVTNPAGKVLAVWHAARLSPELAAAYANSPISRVFLESYWPWRWPPLLSLFFKSNWKTAQQAGIVDRLVFVLGVNQNRKVDLLHDPWSSIPWCDNEATLRVQLGYLKDNCPGSAGVGFYVLDASHITQEFLEVCDRTAFEFFPDA